MDELSRALGGVVILVVVFMVLRHLTLWYWRINEAVDLLHSINRNLELIAGSREPKAEYGPAIDVEKRGERERIGVRRRAELARPSPRDQNTRRSDDGPNASLHSKQAFCVPHLKGCRLADVRLLGRNAYDL